MSVLSQFFGGIGGSGNTIPCEVLIVAGGGTGGACPNVVLRSKSGGGGGGEVIYYNSVNIPKNETFTITVGGSSSPTVMSSSSINIEVGAGGDGAVGGSSPALPGANGDIGSLLTRGSGGGGASENSTPPTEAGTGGNGGFSRSNITVDSYNFSSFVSSGGYPGGAGIAPLGAISVSGGGGGAASAGNASSGGDGVNLSITGSSVEYGAGGDGTDSTGTGSTGAANTGEGGGGSGNSPAFPPVIATIQGGSGIVVFAYKDTYAAATATGTYNQPTRSGYRVYRFTGSGTITFN